MPVFAGVNSCAAILESLRRLVIRVQNWDCSIQSRLYVRQIVPY